ncbi:hypothetical protein GCM10010398_08050 [Streptomyces fimbriatus]
MLVREFRTPAAQRRLPGRFGAEHLVVADSSLSYDYDVRINRSPERSTTVVVGVPRARLPLPPRAVGRHAVPPADRRRPAGRRVHAGRRTDAGLGDHGSARLRARRLSGLRGRAAPGVPPGVAEASVRF